MNETTSPSPGSAVETRSFDAEVHQLLKLMINALYSNREIFLRELISNASDALDKLRFAALTDSSLQALGSDGRIRIEVDAKAGRLAIEDDGIGMSRDEVIDNLGTIARSGTARFLERLSGDRKADAQLIGQFGVGFYSAFIVAEQVTVETLRAGAEADCAVRWRSDGKGEYTLESIKRARHGTRVVLDLAKPHLELLDLGRIRRIVRHYSNHIAFPIHVFEAGAEELGEPVNDTQALWTRPKNEISDQEYREFYQGLSGDFRDPVQWAHHRVEGSQSYTMLLFLPGQAPFDLIWNRDDRRGLKLYIQRVFIMDAAEQLVPRYLRFLRGVVDSADLPLNVSREILQDSPLLGKIRAAVVKRALDMIEKLAADGGEAWATFWREFGNVLKEGLIEDPDNRERIARLLRFASTKDRTPGAVSLTEYLGRIGDGQDAIWYLTGESLEAAASSPHLEAFAAAGVEVLLLTDPIDPWWLPHLPEFEGKPLKSAASGEFEAPGRGDAPSDQERSAADALCQRIAALLGERVAKVRSSRRLVDSASCLAEGASDLNLRMRRMLRQAGQELPPFKPELEINPNHPLVRRLAATEDDARAAELAEVLLDQALLLDGGELADPAGFVRRVNRLLAG